MFTTLLLLSVILSTAKVEHQWVHGALSCPLAKKIVLDKTQTNNMVGNDRANKGKYSDGPKDKNVIVDPLLFIELKEQNGCRKKISSLLKSSKYEEAYEQLKAFCIENPRHTMPMHDFIADCALLTGRDKEAYEIIIRYINRKLASGSELSNSDLLYLSLTSAMVNSLSNGQDEYVKAQLQEGFKNHALINVGFDNELAVRKDAKGVAIKSCLALVWQTGKSCHLELALKLDPANTMIANELICHYEIREQKDDMKRIAEGMLQNLPEGDENREKYQKVINGN